MGRKLDALLGRRRFFYSSKLKALLNLSLSRLSLLKNRCHVRYLHACSDVCQLLQLGHHESALLRVELVLKEQSLLDVYVMIESYCNLLIEKSNLLERQRGCPDELKEAISGLLFASSRCGDFPELQQIRTVFASHFGMEFVTRPVELKNNCSVNPMMIQKLSTKHQSLESRMSLLKETAFKNSISLQLDEDSEVPLKELMRIKSIQGPEEENKQNTEECKSGIESFSEKTADEVTLKELMQIKSIQGHEEENKQNTEECKSGMESFSEKTAHDEGYSSSMETKKKYKDVAEATQAAFEFAAESEQSAVKFSRSDYKDGDDDNGKDNDDNDDTDDYGSTFSEMDENESSGELKFNNRSSSGSDSEDDTKTSNESTNGEKF